MPKLVVIIFALFLPLQAIAGGQDRPPPPVAESSNSGDDHTLISVVLFCIGIEAFTDGTCLFWKWDVWKPKAESETSSVPEPPVNEYLRIRTQ